jgi:hypothetical protein
VVASGLAVSALTGEPIPHRAAESIERCAAVDQAHDAGFRITATSIASWISVQRQ